MLIHIITILHFRIVRKNQQLNCDGKTCFCLDRTQGALCTESMRSVSWNLGGLSTGMMDELLAWLQLPEQAHISIIMLQETHWTHDAEWSSPHWHFIHSGDPNNRYAGVLCMISAKIAPAHRIAYEVLHPGRLLHVKVHWSDAALDVFNLYQIPWNTRSEKQALLQKRGVIWNKLDKALSCRSKRNLILLAGDFNGQLPRSGSNVGTAVLVTEDGLVAEDMRRVLGILQLHHLTALNTWKGPKTRMHTYSMGKSAPQIDFISTSSVEADGRAEGCVPLSDFPVGAWKLDGLHRPLTASVPSGHPKWRHRPARTHRQYQYDLLMSDEALGSQFIKNIQAKLHEGVTDPGCLNHLLLTAASQVLPSAVQAVRKPYHEQEAVMGPIRSLWTLWRQLKHVTGQQLSSLFDAWRVLAAFRRQKRTVQRASRQARRSWVDGMLRQAAEAGRRHHTKGVYDVVRRLAPKAPRKRVQICDTHGGSLGPLQELEELRT